MDNLITLVKMQLKEKLASKRTEKHGSKSFNLLLSVFVAILKFAMVTLLCGAFITVAKMFNLFNYTGYVPPSAISIAFLVMTGFSLLSCTIGLTKSLYYSRDNAVLLTLPCTPNQIFLSKIIIFYVFELIRNFSFIVPVFVAYFFTHGFAVHYYIWMLFCIIFVSMLTVAIAALLSIPGMWLANLFNQRALLQKIVLVVLVGAAIMGVFYAINLIPANIDLLEQSPFIKRQIRNFVDNYAYSDVKAQTLNPVFNMTIVLLGSADLGSFVLGANLLRLLVLLGFVAVFAGLAALIVRPLFYSMASKPFEFLKKNVKPRKNRVHNKKIAAFANEMLVAIKSSDRLYSNVAILFATPILIFLLNKIFAAMSIRELGQFMVSTANVLIIMLIVLNSNTYASSIFSKEGRSSYLIKTQPTNPFGLLLAKLVPNTLFVTLSLVLTYVVMKDTCGLTGTDLLYLLGGIWFIYLAHLLLCAEFDIMNPQNEVYATMGSTESNPNEAKATALAFILSFATAFMVFLILQMHEPYNLYFKIMLVGIAAFVIKFVGFYQNVKLYYKEK